MTKIRSTSSSNVRDRRGQGGGMGGLGIPGLGGGGGGMGIPIGAGGGIVGLLVVLAALFLPRLMGANQGVSTPDQSEGQSSSGLTECRTDLEQIICGAEVDVQDYWTAALPEAYGQAYQPTGLVWFTGSVDTGCGQATSQVGPFYCPLDQTVYFDLEFLVQLQEQFGATGDLAAQYIVAHEFGHHVQNLLGTSDEVNQAQQSDPSRANQYSVALELQADCYAGAWVNSAEDRGLLEPGEVTNEAVNAASAVGDDRIQQQTQGRVDPESWTHGSAEQRASWFRRGYETGDPAQCNTFDEVL